MWIVLIDYGTKVRNDCLRINPCCPVYLVPYQYGAEFVFYLINSRSIKILFYICRIQTNNGSSNL